MITLSKSGNTVTFTFDENSGYLQNGTIDVPVNSLSLIIDESDMATFKKSASNDIFVSARYEDFGMSKADLESWYKANMVGSTGGGITSGEVQTMIDESISGLTVELTQAEYDALVSAGTVASDTYYIITDASAVDISNYWTSAQTESAINQAVSGKQDTLSAGTGIDITNDVISVTGGTGGITSGEVETMISAATTVSGCNDVTIPFQQDISSYETTSFTVTNSMMDVYNSGEQMWIYDTTTDWSDPYPIQLTFSNDPYPTITLSDTNNKGYDLTQFSAEVDWATLGFTFSAPSDFVIYFLIGNATEYIQTLSINNCYVKPVTTFAVEVNNSLSGYAKTSDVEAAVSGKVDTSAFTAFSGDVETALSGKQETLVSGTNIKTINNISLLGSGNISIGGGGSGGTVDQTIESGSTNAVAGGAVYDASHMDKTEIWSIGKSEWSPIETLKVYVYPYEDNSQYPTASLSINYTSYGNWASTAITIDFENETADTISDFSGEFTSDHKYILTYTPPTSGDCINYVGTFSYPYYICILKQTLPSGFTNTVINDGLLPYISSVENTAESAFNNGALGGTDLSLFTKNGGGVQISLEPMFSVDFEKQSDMKIHQNIKVPLGTSGWTNVEFNTSEQGRTNKILADNVKITYDDYSQTTDTEKSMSVNLVGNFQGDTYITYSDGSYSYDSSYIDSVTVSGNSVIIQLSANFIGNNGLINTIWFESVAFYQYTGITSVEYYGELKTPLIDYVKETKSDLGGLKLQQVTQSAYDALVSGGTIDNSTLYVIVN